MRLSSRLAGPGRMSGDDLLTWVAGLAGVAVAAFVKGAVGFGYPLIATPLLALATDVRTAVAVLLLPNILMDSVQVVRRPGVVAALRRHAALIASGDRRNRDRDPVPGRAVDSRTAPDSRRDAARSSWRVGRAACLAAAAARRSARSAPVVGLVAGTLGGITNTPAVVLTPYYFALGLAKAEFVRVVSATFLSFKLTQLAAVWQVGLLDRRILLVVARRDRGEPRRVRARAAGAGSRPAGDVQPAGARAPDGGRRPDAGPRPPVLTAAARGRTRYQTDWGSGSPSRSERSSGTGGGAPASSRSAWIWRRCWAACHVVRSSSSWPVWGP